MMRNTRGGYRSVTQPPEGQSLADYLHSALKGAAQTDDYPDGVFPSHRHGCCQVISTIAAPCIEPAPEPDGKGPMMMLPVGSWLLLAGCVGAVSGVRGTCSLKDTARSVWFSSHKLEWSVMILVRPTKMMSTMTGTRSCSAGDLMVYRYLPTTLTATSYTSST